MTSYTKEKALYGREREVLRKAKELLDVRSQFHNSWHDRLERAHKLKNSIEGAIKELESHDSNADSERLLSKCQKSLHRVNDLISANDEDLKKLESIDNLDEFNVKSLPDDLVEAFVMLESNYEQTGHFNYVLEMFALLVRKGISPPAWVLKDIADRVANYLNEPKRSPETLVKQFGLVGEASGAVNPIDHQDARRKRSMMMIEMAALVRDFNLSRNRAAQAITIKYELTQSVSTTKRWFKEYFGDGLERVIDTKNPIVMTDVERIQFVSSFPPSARKLFKKSSAR